MYRLGQLKIIVETDERASNYGLLIFDEDKREGTLIYLYKGEVIHEQHFEHEGTRQWADKIIDKARSICESHKGKLIKY
jgi:hypothetical protein